MLDVAGSGVEFGDGVGDAAGEAHADEEGEDLEEAEEDGGAEDDVAGDAAPLGGGDEEAVVEDAGAGGDDEGSGGVGAVGPLLDGGGREEAEGGVEAIEGRRDGAAADGFEIALLRSIVFAGGELLFAEFGIVVDVGVEQSAAAGIGDDAGGIDLDDAEIFDAAVHQRGSDGLAGDEGIGMAADGEDLGGAEEELAMIADDGAEIALEPERAGEASVRGGAGGGNGEEIVVEEFDLALVEAGVILEFGELGEVDLAGADIALHVGGDAGIADGDALEFLLEVAAGEVGGELSGHEVGGAAGEGEQEEDGDSADEEIGDDEAIADAPENGLAGPAEGEPQTGRPGIGVGEGVEAAEEAADGGVFGESEGEQPEDPGGGDGVPEGAGETGKRVKAPVLKMIAQLEQTFRACESEGGHRAESVADFTASGCGTPAGSREEGGDAAVPCLANPAHPGAGNCF